MARIRQNRQLPPNASRGHKRLSKVLDEIFRSGGADMTIVYEMPLNKMADSDICQDYDVVGMSVDFYVKELRMAIEFQGIQHYQESSDGFFSGQMARDKRKKQFLKDIGITLIEVPYSIGHEFDATDIKEILGFKC